MVHNCDTKYHTKYTTYTVERLVNKIKKFKSKIVVFTGGEPLLQVEGIKELHKQMLEYCFQLETNGDLINSSKYINNYFVDTFQYLSISPKELKVAQRLKKVMTQWEKECNSYLIEYDIKVVTDLQTVNLKLIPYATSLMPLTTGDDLADIITKRKVWNYCINNNLFYSARLQNELWGSKKGV